MTVCFGAVWTHECFILLMKMDHITQSSCEDKSLRWCCFDYHAVSVTIWLHPVCFFMRRKRYQSSCYWACVLAGEQRQNWLAASSSLTLMTDTSRETASGHLLCQTADYLSGHTRPATWQQADVSAVISCCWCDFNTELLKQINTKKQDLLCSFLAPYLHSW